LNRHVGHSIWKLIVYSVNKFLNTYIKKDANGNVALIYLYVDDIIIIGNVNELIEEIKRFTWVWDERPWWVALLFRPWGMEWCCLDTNHTKKLYNGVN